MTTIYLLAVHALPRPRPAVVLPVPILRHAPAAPLVTPAAAAPVLAPLAIRHLVVGWRLGCSSIIVMQAAQDREGNDRCCPMQRSHGYRWGLLI
jgi:hypothetical protein